MITTRFSSGVYFLFLVYRTRHETYSLGFVGRGKHGRRFVRTDTSFFVISIPQILTANRFSIAGYSKDLFPSARFQWASGPIHPPSTVCKVTLSTTARCKVVPAYHLSILT
jgi:hypothetical protein